ncbi:Elongation factor Tu GTP binding domain containing protein [Tritrichomonas foetus]|uniref:Elongation factor Tu GTP binding domain containing protein n=1 Tax=Tritrichomonas foetus TaxID=1144522 RepID=A0A1J4KL13_9EUKA|nr:Elongation factor Tu GTP binding domain containing protein [Tritrichomonas foetus]|eukprot:OHT11983.1 Elongation factor Tu GTP binding domain containing protein [Tritrichomonas foetus]
MFKVNKEQIDKLLSRPDHIYNFCILAHVDHGKTTLCDHLLATNGIISKELAGEIRYMDCLPAERDRNITMKTSAVSLLAQKERDLYYMTVVDSPGHVDFEAEVSNAVRLADGCIILVDAVEGVCVQTELVLRVAMREKLAAILVINKIDRLFVELGMDPQAAEIHLQQLLTEVNAATMLQDSPFDPTLGNVVFASCQGKWGVSVPKVACQWAEKLKISEETAINLFWDNNYYDPVRKVITKKQPDAKSLTFFAQSILMPIYKAYRDPKEISSTELQQMAKRLNVEIGPRDNAVNIIAKWMPLSVTLIENVLKFLHTPLQSQSEGLTSICPDLNMNEELFNGAVKVDSNTKTLAFAPKIVHGGLLRFPPGAPTYKFVAYLRVYCGSIKVGDKLYVSHVKTETVTEITVTSLYIFMGNELITINRAAAGCVVGIGLNDPMLKQSTLSSVEDAPLFKSTTHYAQPIVKVSLEAEDLTQQATLVEGAELLAKIDPAVVISNESNGQLLMSCMGEVHLQFCIDELKNYLAKVEFSVSEPLVPCKETVTKSSPKVSVSAGATSIEASCFSLPKEAIDILEKKQALLATKDINNVNIINDIKEELTPILGEKLVQNIIDVNSINILIADEQFSSFHNSLIAGFRLCVSAGPLCEEPIFGVCFTVESVSIRQLTLEYLLQMDDESAFAPASSDAPLQFGEAIGCTKEAFRAAFQEATPRILEPMYRCEVQSDFTVIGKTYEVLQAHRCKIVEEKQKEGINSTFISCFLPVIESFGFPNDLGSKTSGKAYPQLVFSHFELVTDDPFWKPQTEEELEYYSKNGKELRPNIAKKIIEYVRKRKGIWFENIEQKNDRRATMGKSK